MKYYIMILFSCIFSWSQSQNCSSTLSGEVHDFHDGTPITNATIYIKSLNKYTTTDVNGYFFIKDLCNDAIVFEVTHLACETKNIDIDIDGDTFLVVNLEHHIEELNEVKVKGASTSKITKTTQETILKSETIDRFSSLNLGDVLKQISGVSSINTGSTIVKPVINGLHSSRIIVMTNGVRLQDQEWGIEHAPNIDLNTAGSINVIKGANALAYGGDAIGGVIVLKPSKISLKDSLYGKSIITGHSNGRGYNFNTSLTKTYKKGWYLGAQTSLKRFGDFKSPDYYLTNTGLNAKGLSFNGGFKSFEKGFNVYYSYLDNQIGILRASHIGNVEDLVNAINNPKPLVIEDFAYDINAPKQEVTHHVFKTEFYKRFKKFGRVDVQYDYQNNHRFEYDIRVGDDRDKAAVDLTLKTHTLKTSVKLDSKSNITYQFGLNAGYQNNFADPNTGVRRLIPDYDKYDAGAFVISNLRLNNDINVDFGLRYDFNQIDAKKFYLTSRWNERAYNNEFANLVIDDLGTQLLTNPIFNYHNISASAGISYQINDRNNFIFNYGLSNRAPNPSELFSDGLHHSAARIELGDLRLKKETSNRVSATYNYQNKGLSLSAETFYNYINDYIFVRPTGTEQTIRGAFPVWSYNQTNAVLYGLDVTANYTLNEQWFLKNKSSYIKGKDVTKNDALIDMPSVKTVNSLGFSNKKWLNLKTELQSELVFKQTNFPNNNFEVYIPTTEQMVLVDVSSTPPTYHLLHLQSNITLTISEKSNLNIGLNITNLLNTNYRENLNRLRYFADDLGRNIMLQLKLNY
ncbi:TonB-dependent receptor [Olleya namhaensis]|uniref:Iron complex outermembrane recepter protein n=1 Tax=Olleya namhaensis TaxID=1144750 RepID=A0A1I3RDG0_9FLAO|nr:TonB-dependent receptor [Olleya namhaensis]SFJ44298.1 iron complex outermembrane recepter protein [Olleya namhaensis]